MPLFVLGYPFRMGVMRWAWRHSATRGIVLPLVGLVVLVAAACGPSAGDKATHYLSQVCAGWGKFNTSFNNQDSTSIEVAELDAMVPNVNALATYDPSRADLKHAVNDFRNQWANSSIDPFSSRDDSRTINLACGVVPA